MVLQRVASSSFSKNVLYIGSAIPLETSEGLEAVQMPLRNRYPANDEENLQGMMSTVTVLPAGIQLRFKDDQKQVVLFPYSSLTLCAAVRCIKVTDSVTKQTVPRFVSLTSPEASGPNSNKPAIFTAITRRTKGRQVLECHGFITMHPKDALDLVDWVGAFDRKAKQENYKQNGGPPTPNYESSVQTGEMSFKTDGDVPDFPVTIVPGEPNMLNAAPSFYKEQPLSGYFYTTKDAQVKKYSLQKLGDGMSTMGGRSTASGAPVMNGATSVEDVAQSIPPGPETVDTPRTGYAGSTMSAPAYVRPPIIGYRPVPMPLSARRPILVGPPPPPPMYGYPQPRFFAPPPPGMMRTRPVPVLIPGPMAGPPPPLGYPGPHPRRGSRGSSGSGSSSPDASPSSPRMNGKPKKPANGVQKDADDSSDSGSRPRSPPTDYDLPKGPRASRKDDHYMRQAYSARGPPPQAYYIMAPYGHYPPPPPMGLVRAQSVPPPGERGRKEKKSKKSKKDRKKSKKGSREAHDEPVGSLGYTSELGPNQPRDFRRFENQFQHERAFSKSLAEETRKSTRGDPLNAYNLNSDPVPAGKEGESPLY